jgi:hypothetical protein
MEVLVWMTELQLYRFLKGNGTTVEWRGEELIAFIYFGHLQEFANLINQPYLCDECFLANPYVGINLVPVCEYYDIIPENIMIKQN